MNEHGREKCVETDRDERHDVPSDELPARLTDDPILLSITPDGASIPGESGEAAELRRQLEQHARDVEEYVRAQRFSAIVSRVLGDVERRDPTAPPMRLRK